MLETFLVLTNSHLAKFHVSIFILDVFKAKYVYYVIMTSLFSIMSFLIDKHLTSK